MNKGGVSSSGLLQQIIRVSGLFLSIVISAYTLAVTFDIIPNPAYEFSVQYGVVLSLTWIIAGILEYLLFSTSKLNVFVRVIGYHILGFVYLTTVTGFESFPFIFAWGVLSIITYIYYSAKGVWFNLIIMFFTALADTLLHLSTPDIVLNNAVSAFSIAIVIVIFVMFFRVQERDDNEFIESKKNELLERERLATLINNLVDGVVSLDPEGVISIYNAATLNLLDTNTSIGGKSVDSIIRLESNDGTRVKLLPLLKKMKSLTISDEYFAKVGDERIRLELTLSPINSRYGSSEADAEGDGYIILFRDITKAKSLEEERDEFISVVSHELRTPIAITEGAIDNAQLIFSRDDSKKEVITKTLHMAHEQVLFLSKMVNDLSTLSRAERGAADEAEVIDVKELAHGLLDEYKPEANKQGLTLNLSATGHLGTIKASKLYVQELLQNFITNSIKYTKEGSVDITINKKGGQIVFAVSDTGIGISKSDVEKIFQKFYRSEDYSTRETGGTGLGLYVAQKLAKKLGTHIQVSSRLNHGSKFWFEIKQIADETTHV